MTELKTTRTLAGVEEATTSPAIPADAAELEAE